ncbi:MAG: hypothetical protein ACJ75B_08620 [Flavisolibacter sp.]
MHLLAHRGFWKKPEEKNSRLAFEMSAREGYGIETDIRDAGGELVIAHNMPVKGEVLMSFSEFLELYLGKSSSPGYLAINIKADGLQDAVRDELQRFKVKKYFVFDMSVPDTLGYQKLGLNFFSRVSEYETSPILFEECAGIWLDAFHSEWYQCKQIGEWVSKGKQICIVSPEVHKRPHQKLWEELKTTGLHLLESVLLCTDFPDQARNFFHEQ